MFPIVRNPQHYGCWNFTSVAPQTSHRSQRCHNLGGDFRLQEAAAAAAAAAVGVKEALEDDWTGLKGRPVSVTSWWRSHVLLEGRGSPILRDLSWFITAWLSHQNGMARDITWFVEGFSQQLICETAFRDVSRVTWDHSNWSTENGRNVQLHHELELLMSMVLSIDSIGSLHANCITPSRSGWFCCVPRARIPCRRLEGHPARQAADLALSLALAGCEDKELFDTRHPAASCWVGQMDDVKVCGWVGICFQKDYPPRKHGTWLYCLVNG